MKETIICVALKTESNGVFENVIDQHKHREHFHVIYTNVGKVNAAYFLTKKIYELKAQNKDIGLVLNIGTAGGKNISRGSIVGCNEFIQRDFDHTPLGIIQGVNTSFCDNNNLHESPFCNLVISHKKILHDIEHVVCGTGDNFETDKVCHSAEISELNKSAEDMEAYALGLVCKYENIDFTAIKYISDEIGKKANQDEDFNDAITVASDALGLELKKQLTI